MFKQIAFFCLAQLVFFVSLFSSFDRFDEKWTKDEIEERLALFLKKDGNLGSFFTITEDQIILYNGPETQKDREIDFSLKLAKEKGKGEKQKKKQGLVGLKIAIDPGHFGGMYSRLEERYIDLPPSVNRERPIQFDEGTLSLLTALYLKVLLEKEGAIVFLTRDRIGRGVYPEDFFDWLRKHPSLWSGEVSLTRLFRRFYNPLDLRARAKIINAFEPDLTIVIHYNSHHVEEEASSNNAVTSKNYNLVFVPGAFCRGELTEHENRYEFMRLLATGDLHESLHLSRCILQAFNTHLNVPVVTKEDGANYLQSVCLQLEEGIFARNLALTRLIHGPVCYGETLIQNNIDECENLSRKDFVIGGEKCSSRIKQVAEAYFEGVQNYVLSEVDGGKKGSDPHHNEENRKSADHIAPSLAAG